MLALTRRFALLLIGLLIVVIGAMKFACDERRDTFTVLSPAVGCKVLPRNLFSGRWPHRFRARLLIAVIADVESEDSTATHSRLLRQVSSARNVVDYDANIVILP